MSHFEKFMMFAMVKLAYVIYWCSQKEYTYAMNTILTMDDAREEAQL